MKKKIMIIILVLAFIGFVVWIFLDTHSPTYAEPVNSRLPAGSLDALHALGYLDYSPRPAENPGEKGVVLHNRDKAYQGYNLYQGLLMDMDGNVVHSFSNKHLGVIFEDGRYAGQRRKGRNITGFYRWDSMPIWERGDILIHHDITPTSNGRFLTLGKHVVILNNRSVEFDVIIEFDEEGRALSSWSTYENMDMLHRTHPRVELDMPPSYHIPEKHKVKDSYFGGDYDYYHLNAVNLVPQNRRQGVHETYRPGNWIITSRHVNVVAILDKQSKNVLWSWGPGELEGPHAARMLESGNILIFDNGRHRNYSRVIELDPHTLKIVWEYRYDDFFTYTRGFAQRLPNGNTLITESDEGRVFEVTSEKEVVWEFYHPALDIDGKRMSIYRMNRYPLDYIDRIIANRSKIWIKQQGEAC